MLRTGPGESRCGHMRCPPPSWRSILGRPGRDSWVSGPCAIGSLRGAAQVTAMGRDLPRQVTNAASGAVSGTSTVIERCHGWNLDWGASGPGSRAGRDPVPSAGLHSFLDPLPSALFPSPPMALLPPQATLSGPGGTRTWRATGRAWLALPARPPCCTCCTSYWLYLVVVRVLVLRTVPSRTHHADLVEAGPSRATYMPMPMPMPTPTPTPMAYITFLTSSVCATCRCPALTHPPLPLPSSLLRHLRCFSRASSSSRRPRQFLRPPLAPLFSSAARLPPSTPRGLLSWTAS